MIIINNKEAVTIELHGKEQFWALRAKITVPLDAITDIRFESLFQDWRKWEIRMPGTHAPKLLLAGSYWTEEGWDFLYIKRPTGYVKPRAQNVLVIETTEQKYRRVIVTSDKKTVEGLQKWWKQVVK